MPRDLPDWGALSAQATVYEMTDLGELAVRLGSTVSHDRRGDVIWFDDFECGIGKWNEAASGDGAGVGLTTDRARNGETSVLLTAGKDDKSSAEISHPNAFPVLTNMGFEVSFSLGSLLLYFDVTVDLYDGTNHIEFSVYWDAASEVLFYLSGDGTPVVLATGVSLWYASTLFHTLKLVWDAVTGKYVRLLLDSQVYPMDDLPGYAVGLSDDYYMKVTVKLWGRPTYNDTLYVDDPILTQNEPANA